MGRIGRKIKKFFKKAWGGIKKAGKKVWGGIKKAGKWVKDKIIKPVVGKHGAAIGTAVGTAIGSYAGNPAMGAKIGAGIGGIAQRLAGGGGGQPQTAQAVTQFYSYVNDLTYPARQSIYDGKTKGIKSTTK